MAYQRLILDPSTPLLVKGLIRKVEIFEFSDIHSMLRLPLNNYRITAGCNRGITHALMAVIGGISTTLYKQSGNVGAKFKGVLIDYFPWDLEPQGSLAPEDAADIIYEVFRNPLTHDLGLDVKKKSQGRKVLIKRLHTKTPSGKYRGLTEVYIERLERAQGRPSPSATVTVTPTNKVLLVECLYWGIRRTIERLSADHTRMTAAERFLAKPSRNGTS